ncbi:MAG: F0F1 ATP synthase subunit delta [Rhodocyclaceae bacterium]|nr:F0F1 ATP synthase subunit delta [Rhodocyclaceae bacterium]
MEFDWMTVVLEALNFLVLVWLLKRFFYRPVLAVIEKRRADSEKILTDAATLRRDAEALKGEYESRLAAAGRERDLALARLDEEIARERARRHAVVEAEAAADRQRRQMLEARESREREALLQRQAVAVAGRFATRFLERLAGPELEARLVDLALDELRAAAPEQLAVLAAALREPGARVEVVTAHPLDGARRAALNAALARLAGRTLDAQFGEDAVLKAGLCLAAGSWVLMANLRDELKFFTGALEHGA